MSKVQIQKNGVFMVLCLSAFLLVGCGPSVRVQIVDDLPADVAKGIVEFYPVYGGLIDETKYEMTTHWVGRTRVMETKIYPGNEAFRWAIDVYEINGPDTVLLGQVWEGMEGSQIKLRVARSPGEYHFLLNPRPWDKTKKPEPVKVEVPIRIDDGMLTKTRVIVFQTDDKLLQPNMKTPENAWSGEGHRWVYRLDVIPETSIPLGEDK